MKLDHLAIAVADQRRSIDFYSTYFGFDAETVKRYPDGVVIIHNGHGFALALGPGPAPPRGFPHFGFSVASAAEARALLARLAAAGIEIVEREDTDAYTGFKCLDPDGNVVEVSYEP